MVLSVPVRAVVKHGRIEIAAQHGGDGCTKHANCRGFGRRSDTEENRSEHHDDDHGWQDQRRQSPELLGPARLAAVFARRDHLRLDVADDENIADIEQAEQEYRARCPQSASCRSRPAPLPNRHGQQYRGRDQNAKRSGGTDRSRCKSRVIAAFEHFRQREDTHGRDCRADDASHGCHHQADDHRADRKSAANSAEPELHRRIKIANDVRALQQHAMKM